MQVATLFRESANLLGASSMDTPQTHHPMQQQQQQMQQQQAVDYNLHMQHHHYKM